MKKILILIMALGAYFVSAGQVWTQFDFQVDSPEAQAKIIKQELSKVIGQYAVHYLESAYTKISSGSDRRESFHGLSEGYGFILSLQFTKNPTTSEPYYNIDEVNAMLTEMDDFWTVTPAALKSMASNIETKFGF